MTAGLTFAAWLPEALTGWKILSGVLVTGGLPFLISEWIADRGRAKQADLWQSWGGPPTIQFLRHRDQAISVPAKTRIHAALRSLSPELDWPRSTDQEMADPDAADEVYGAATDVLRVYAREHQKEFPTVYAANIRYGFRRNLWAVRPTAILLATASLTACGVRLWPSAPWAGAGTGLSIAALLVSLVMVLTFAFIVTDNWVRAAADIYAHRLLESAQEIALRSAPSPHQDRPR